jgi:hypothetical protein
VPLLERNLVEKVFDLPEHCCHEVGDLATLAQRGFSDFTGTSTVLLEEKYQAPERPWSEPQGQATMNHFMVMRLDSAGYQRRELRRRTTNAMRPTTTSTAIKAPTRCVLSCAEMISRPSKD